MHSGKYDVYITVGTGYLNFGFFVFCCTQNNPLKILLTDLATNIKMYILRCICS
jgi:hypothetical protein